MWFGVKRKITKPFKCPLNKQGIKRMTTSAHYAWNSMANVILKGMLMNPW